jgi:hypothetical protein
MTIKFRHTFFLFLFALFSFTACQDETTEVDNTDNQETLEPSSTLANLMSRASANFGAADNILDESSCFSVELPVTIVVSDITIIIETEADLEQLEDIFEELEDDEEFLDFVFPITIIFSDYSEIVIENQDQLEDFIEQCDEDDDVIECVDFVYPISFSVFNNEFDFIDTVVIESDVQLYTFLDDLEGDDNVLIVSLNYPVTLEYANGETLEVNSNQELVEAIEIAQEDCDDSEEENDCNEEDIAELLVECPWNINDEFNDFEMYQFVFYEDGTLAITEGDTTNAIGGAWNIGISDEGIILNISDLTAFQDDLGGEWLIIECESDELVIERGDFTIELEQDCEDDLDCTAPEVNANLLECAWLLETDLIDSVIPIYVYFTQNGQVLNANQENTETVIGSYDVTIISSQLYIEFNLENGFEDLNGLWEIVECEEGNIYLIKNNNYIELEQDCDYNEGNEVFECFGDFELIECNGPNNEAEFNLSADTIGLIDCQYSFIPSFHITELDASNNTNAISNTESFWSASGEVFLRIEADNGNFEIFTIYLNVEDCTEDLGCLETTDIVLCDEDNDGYEVFNLYEGLIEIEDCEVNDTVSVNYYLTIADAESNSNPLAEVTSFTNITNPQTIYVRIELFSNPNIYQILEMGLYLEDCNPSGCSEQEVDTYLAECTWIPVNYNGDDNLINWILNFEVNSQVVVMTNGESTVTATYSTSQSDNGVVIEFSNVAGPDIQAISGSWLVVECENDRLQLHRENDILILEQNCD